MVFFGTQGQVTLKVDSLVGFLTHPRFYDSPGYPIKHEGTMPGTTFTPLQVYGKFFRRSRASNSKTNSPISPIFERR